ncbi:MAG: hypothetical protein SFW66_10185 [Gammaproteobacteria bacterium]|nr:hypothetical protein [Gammaproteobacteria bacterium]
MSYSTIATRLLAGTAAVGAVGTLGLYLGTKWKVASNVQTGIIANTGRQGLLIKTNELSLQRSHVSTGHIDGDMHMSLYRNKDLAEKAKEYCQQAQFVCVRYDEYFLRNPFFAESARRVRSIEPVDESSQHASAISMKRA